jgi:hypothetical protein
MMSRSEVVVLVVTVVLRLVMMLVGLWLDYRSEQRW